MGDQPPPKKPPPPQRKISEMFSVAPKLAEMSEPDREKALAVAAARRERERVAPFVFLLRIAPLRRN